MTLVGLLVAMTLMLLVMGAAITVFGQFDTITRKTELQNDAQDRSRTGVDQLVRELRNLASPTPETPAGGPVAGPTDLVFQTVDKPRPNRRHATRRTSSASATADARTDALPRRPGARGRRARRPRSRPRWAALPRHRLGPDGRGRRHVVNRDDRGRCSPTTAPTTADHPHRLGLALRTTRGAAASTEVTSGIFLRNQNRFPVATFSRRQDGHGLVLNGAGSSDPEGDNLTYEWSDNGAVIGSGVAYTYGPLVSGSNHISP